MSKKNVDIESILNSVLDFTAKENAEKFKKVASNEVILKALQYAEEGLYEEFDLELLDPIDGMIEGLLESVSSNKKLHFLLRHGSFVERHFNELISKYEGVACCSDKSRTIMRALLDFHINSKPIEFKFNQEYTYHLPKKIFTTHDSIVEFSEALMAFFYGQPYKYLASIQNVIQTAQKYT